MPKIYLVMLEIFTCIITDDQANVRCWQNCQHHLFIYKYNKAYGVFLPLQPKKKNRITCVYIHFVLVHIYSQYSIKNQSTYNVRARPIRCILHPFTGNSDVWNNQRKCRCLKVKYTHTHNQINTQISKSFVAIPLKPLNQLPFFHPRMHDTHPHKLSRR